MNQTIKQKIQAQISLNSKLLYYDDSDEEESNQLQKAQKQSFKNQENNENHFGEDNNLKQSFQMKIKCQKMLRQILNQQQQQVIQKPKQIYKTTPKKCRSQKQNMKQNMEQAYEMKIVQLKSKLAQLIKQNQQKQTKLQKLQSNQIVLKSIIKSLQKEGDDKEKQVETSQNQLKKLKSSIRQIEQKTKEYDQKLIEKQSEIREQRQRNEMLVNQLERIKDMSQSKFDELSDLVKLKDEEIQSIKKIQIKSQNLTSQNLKLKTDLQKLQEIVWKYQKQNSKLLKTYQDPKNLTSKSFKSRAKSMLSPCSQLFTAKNKTIQDASRVSANNYLSVQSRKTNTFNFSSWFPTILINQVQCFLKKQHMGYNNQKFVNKLVEFINSYTQKCVNESKNKMQNQYKSLKKDIQRRTNQCLSIREVVGKKKQIIKNVKKHKRNRQKYQESDLMSLEINNLTQQEDLNYTNYSHLQKLTLQKQSQLISYKNLQKSLAQHNKRHSNFKNELEINLPKQTTPIKNNQKPLLISQQNYFNQHKNISPLKQKNHLNIKQSLKTQGIVGVKNKSKKSKTQQSGANHSVFKKKSIGFKRQNPTIHYGQQRKSSVSISKSMNNKNQVNKNIKYSTLQKYNSYLG